MSGQEADPLLTPNGRQMEDYDFHFDPKKIQNTLIYKDIDVN